MVAGVHVDQAAGILLLPGEAVVRGHGGGGQAVLAVGVVALLPAGDATVRRQRDSDESGTSLLRDPFGLDGNHCAVPGGAAGQCEHDGR